MADIFLSYKREKKERVRRLVEALGRAGYSVYWDARLRASARFIQALNLELSSARCVIVAWCHESVASSWVISECLKVFGKDNLLPIKIEPIDDNLIPAPFNSIQTADLSKWNGDDADPIWLQLKDDVAHVIDARRGETALPTVIEDEADVTEEDIEAITSEIYGSVAVAGAAAPAVLPALDAAELMKVKAVIQQCVERSAGRVAQSSVAWALKTQWPSQTGQYKWFGHKRFAKFFESLQFKDLVIDTTVPGYIVRRSQAAVPLRAPAPALDLKKDQKLIEELGHKVFEATGAPNMPPATYRAVIRTIATVVQGGGASLTDISKKVRDQLAKTATPVSRARASFITKGSLIAGLNLELRPMAPAMVANYFLSSLGALCKANELELSPLEEDQMYAVIGFPELLLDD